MKLYEKRQTICEDTLSYFGVLEDEDIVKAFGDNLKEQVHTIKELSEKDYNDLTNEELFYLLNKIYSIVVEEKDVLKYISNKNNREYSSIRTIPTTMSFTADKKDSRGRIMDYWKEKYQVFLEVALAKDKDLPTRDNITKEELKELIDKKDIIVLDYDTLEVDDVIRDEEEFDNTILKFFDISRRMLPDNKLYKEEFDYYMNLLKEKLPRKKLLKELSNYLKDLIQDIYDLFVSSSLSYGYGTISSNCKEWYKNSDIKDEINNLTISSKKKS